MGEAAKRRSSNTDWLGLVSFGFFLILVGGIWLFTPTLADETIRFFKDFELKNVTSNILLPAPKDVSSHTILYTAVMQFCFIFAAFEIVILILRFVLRDTANRKADAVSGAAFWLSAGYFLSLLAGGFVGWFGFVAGLIISGGIAIVVTSIFKLFR